MMTAARNRYFERLTRKNAALLLVDHQIGLFTGIRDIDVAQLKHNVVALAKAATTLGLPIIVTTTAAGSMWGPTIPELKAALPTARIIDRSKVNAWDEPRIVEVIAATGRKKLIIAGISTEVCVAFAAIAATAAGYDVYAAIDACGTFSETKRTTGILRMMQAGVIVTDYASIAVEMLNDNADAKAAQLYAALDLPYAALVGQLTAALGRPAA